MLKRLLERAKTSGREDDNEESIRKRFRTSCSRGLFWEALTNDSAGVYKEQTMPVIEHYSKEGKVATVRQVPQMFPSTHAHVVPRSTRRPRSRMCTQRLRRLWPRSWLVRSAVTSPHEVATREDDLDTRRTIYRNNAALVSTSVTSISEQILMIVQALVTLLQRALLESSVPFSIFSSI